MYPLIFRTDDKGDAPGRMSTVPAFTTKSIPYVCPESSQKRREGLLDDLEVVHVASLGDSAEEECAVCLCKLNGSEGQDTPGKDDDDPSPGVLRILQRIRRVLQSMGPEHMPK